MDNVLVQPRQGWWIFKNKEQRELAKAEKEATKLAKEAAKQAKVQNKASGKPKVSGIDRLAYSVGDDIYETPSAQQKNTTAQTYWAEQMQKHPGFHFFLSVLGSIIEFFFGGHFIVWLARKMILFASRTAESVLLFGSLWISAIYSAHDFMVKNSFGQADTLTNMSVLSFTLLPEIVLFSAIITCVIHWYSAIAKKQKSEYVWAILYSLPTIVFFGLAIITFTAVVESQNHTIPMAQGWSLVMRAVTSWIFALIGMVHAGLRKRFPSMSSATTVATQNATMSVSEPAQSADVSVTLPRVKRPAVATKMADLMATQEDTKEPQFVAESGYSEGHSQGHYPNTGELEKVATPKVTTADDILATNEATNTDPNLATPVATPKANSKVTKKLNMNDLLDTQEDPKKDTKQPQKKAPKKDTKPTRLTAKDRAIRVLNNNKHKKIGPDELSTKAQISYSYAKKILAEKAS